MAGGKETPRQKMIGMMYLVLTALLALNVSKSILDAFVAIEENIQISNENEFTRGQEKYEALKEVAQDKTQKDLMAKAQKLMKTVDQIDKITAERIKLIDDIKLEILKTCGEDITTIGGKESIIVKAYSAADPLKPTRMNLQHVSGKDKYDEPMQIMIGEEITNPNPNGQGMKLWKSYNAYRKELTELIASSVIVEKGMKPYYFKAPEINKFKDFKDLNAQIDKAISASNVAQDDKEAIKKIYGSLTKQERSEVHEVPNVHWIGKTFDHSPSVAALASLSSMQKEILTARADAVALIRSRVGGGEYSFNKIMALAYGPDLANNGDEIEVQVLMAAYDSDKQPEVTVQGASVSEIKDGKGYIRTKASGASEMTLKGTITIKNKSGVPKTENWEKTIKIMKPQGTVALPDMRVLYRGYDNVVEAVASGYDQTNVSGNGVTLTKKGPVWIGKPGAGKTCKITVSGKSSITNKSVNLGTFEFQIQPMPKAEIFWGAYADGDKATTRTARILYAKYGPGIPLTKAKFEVDKWILSITGAPKPISGSGPNLTEDAMRLLKAAPAGSIATFSCIYKGTGTGGKPSTAAIKL
jgi:gliding motility-associated protein GldM